MAGEIMKRKDLIRTCQQYDEYCQGCSYATPNGGCEAGQPWKQAGIHAATAGNRRSTNENT